MPSGPVHVQGYGPLPYNKKFQIARHFKYLHLFLVDFLPLPISLLATTPFVTSTAVSARPIHSNLLSLICYGMGNEISNDVECTWAVIEKQRLSL